MDDLVPYMSTLIQLWRALSLSRSREGAQEQSCCETDVPWSWSRGHDRERQLEDFPFREEKRFDVVPNTPSLGACVEAVVPSVAYVSHALRHIDTGIAALNCGKKRVNQEVSLHTSKRE